MCHGRRSPRRRGRPEPAPLLQHSMKVQCRERASADKGAKVIVRSSLRRGGRARARGQGWAVARQGECEQGPRQRTHHTVAGGYLMTAIGSAPERSAPRHTRSRSPARKMQTNFKQSIPGGQCARGIKSTRPGLPRDPAACAPEALPAPGRRWQPCRRPVPPGRPAARAPIAATPAV